MYVEPTTFPVVATADYQATIAEVEAVTSEWQGQTRQRFQFRFDLQGAVLDSDGEPVEDAHVMGWTSQILSAGSNLGKLVAACGLDPTEAIDTDDLARRTVTIAVTVATKDNGELKNVVDMANVRPARKGKGTNGQGTNGQAAKAKPAQSEIPEYADMDIPF